MLEVPVIIGNVLEDQLRFVLIHTAQCAGLAVAIFLFWDVLILRGYRTVEELRKGNVAVAIVTAAIISGPFLLASFVAGKTVGL